MKKNRILLGAIACLVALGLMLSACGGSETWSEPTANQLHGNWRAMIHAEITVEQILEMADMDAEDLADLLSECMDCWECWIYPACGGYPICQSCYQCSNYPACTSVLDLLVDFTQLTEQDIVALFMGLGVNAVSVLYLNNVNDVSLDMRLELDLGIIGLPNNIVGILQAVIDGILDENIFPWEVEPDFFITGITATSISVKIIQEGIELPPGTLEMVAPFAEINSSGNRVRLSIPAEMLDLLAAEGIILPPGIPRVITFVRQ